MSNLLCTARQVRQIRPWVFHPRQQRRFRLHGAMNCSRPMLPWMTPSDVPLLDSATALGNELAEHVESMPSGMLATDTAEQDTMTLESTLVEVGYSRLARVVKLRIRDISWNTEKRAGD